jgi:hypothetical protein
MSIVVWCGVGCLMPFRLLQPDDDEFIPGFDDNKEVLAATAQ